MIEQIENLKRQFQELLKLYPERYTIVRHLRTSSGDIDFQFPHANADGINLDFKDNVYVLSEIERGKTNVIDETQNADDALFWVVSIVTRWIARDYELEHRIDGQDSRRQWMSLHVKLLRRAKNAWADRKKIEYNQLLIKSPFSDGLQSNVVDENGYIIN